ncbi:MAG TPA: immunoglobulin domain-containing protein, partial [Bacteroidia bacterium]|nr:immunoglobulin domain-containing protein [Bacteroidia bacterium]
MIRRITFLSPALFALLNFTNNASAQMFTPGNIVVEQVGDGTSALASGVAAPLFLVEYSATGTLTNSVALPVAGPNVITTSGTATSEGNISLSANGRYIIVPGYNALPGTTGLTSTTSATVARVTGQVDASGTYSMPSVTNTYFSGNNIRGAASDGNNNYWATGANTGACYFGTGTPAIVYSTNTNNRAMAVYNGNLMFSAGAGTRGIYQFTGMPTTASAASLILPLTGSPYQFAINSTSTILYVADDASFTSTSSQAGGIEKFTWNGSAWVFQYTLQCGNASTAGARGLVVDFSGTNPVVYASTAESSSNRIISITDAGASSGSSATLLATAATNTIFRGLAFSPCSPPSITTVSSNSPVCSGSTLNLSSAVTGSAPLTYSWTGPNSFSGNTANPSISSVTTAAAGTYMLNLSNACGSASQNTTVVVNTPPSITTITNTSPVCSGSDINFNSAASGSAPLTFSWTGPNSFSSNSATPSITGATPLANGIYTLTVTNGCGSDMQTTVAFASLPVASTTSQTDVTCNGANDGTASVTVSG